MTDNLFDNAKFGDMYLTSENKQAVFLRLTENAEYKFAILYIEGWGQVQVFRHNGKEIYNDAAHSIISKQEEPVDKCKGCNNVKGCVTCVDGDQWAHYEDVSEDLEEASKEWLRPQLDKSYAAYGETKQMEFTHFDGFDMIDAIEFGAKWKEQQMMTKAIVREVKVDAGGYPYIDTTELYDYDKDMPLAKEGDKVKVIILNDE